MANLADMALGVPGELTLLVHPGGVVEKWSGPGAPPKNTLTVTYDANYLTGAYILESRKVRNDDERIGAIHEFISVVQSWDLKDDGKPIPLTEEALSHSKIPLPFLNNIVAACVKDMSVGEAK